jgi:hypothetical protein
MVEQRQQQSLQQLPIHEPIIGFYQGTKRSVIEESDHHSTPTINYAYYAHQVCFTIDC